MSRTASAASTERRAVDARRGAPALLLAALLGGCGLGTPQLRTAGGTLADCDRMRCVSSLATDPDRRVEPIRYAGTADAARLALVRILAQMDGAQVVTQSEDYVHARFTSRVMRWVDDLELSLAPGERVVHVRSASRIGYYDFDVNRERIETLRARFDALQP